MAAASSPYGLVVWGTHIVIMLMTRVKPCEETDQQHKIGPSVNLRSKATQLHPQQVKVIALVMRCHAFEPTVFQMLDMAARLYKPLMDQKLRFCVRRNLIRLCEPSTGTTSQDTTDETKSHSGGGDQDASNIDSTGGGPATRSKKGSKDKQSGGQTSRETGEPGAGKSSNLHFMAAPFLKEPSPESCHKPPRRPKPCGEWQQCAHAVPLQSMLDLHPRPCAHVRVIGPVPGQPELLLRQAQPRNAVTVKLATSFIGARPSTEYEFQVLEDLRDIQGTWVPYAVCTTYVSLLYFRAAALLLEYVGPWSAEHLRRSYVRSIRDRIAAAFKALHEQGVCHGDVALRNVVVSYDHWPVIIDFERSIRRCTYDQAPGAWQKLVADEWQEVLDMLEYSSGEKPLLVTEGSEGTSGEI